MKHQLTEWIYRNLQGGYCPDCGQWFEPNGTGPAGDEWTNKLLKWALRQLPWDDILNEEAVPVHDWRCFFGPHPMNITFDDTTSEFKDNVEAGIGRWVDSASWWRKPLRKACKAIIWQHIDELYAKAVGDTEAGKKAYFTAHNCIRK